VGFCDEVMFVLLIQLGSTAIGLKTKDGVVLAVEKRVTSPLLVLTESLLLNWS
jgi:20S proteasome alpha/beta subunit